ncbi:hypothetical protein Theam_0204 [Thermovibrio ammonificans HB-1]|uniref:Uncharacterized protein n=1 Tax=Thermovibrio ammonificans (strain DSM 15698 / JCM 12110 / HB-1) TaxID=648996 RepID=E8T3W7_THEA1|nr:CHASE2 domain-containing protein [Thermovibrio ammonificans]ADU96177.1 hypothetical protein Theam_0204 [Thermovibrio ammonificans HB-1]
MEFDRLKNGLLEVVLKLLKKRNLSLPVLCKTVTRVAFLSALILFFQVKTPLFSLFSGVTESVNRLLWAVVQAVNGEVKNFNSFAVTAYSGSGHKVDIYTVTPGLYSLLFGRVSPLDRCKLAELVDGIERKGYRLIVFDLDLSPLCSGSTPFSAYYDRCQRRLDGELKLLASSGSLVVVMEPSAVSGTGACVERWKEELQRAGVHFASPYLLASGGVVLSYPPNSLASVAFALAGGERPKKEFLISYKDVSFKRGPSNAEVAFVGGSFDGRDYFYTPQGKMPGLFIHAAAFLTLYKPYKSWKFLSYLFTFLFVMLVSRLFERLLSGYFEFRSVAEGLNASEEECLFTLNYLRSLALFVLAMFFLFFCFSFVALVFNVVLSPVPILISGAFEGAVRYRNNITAKSISIELFQGQQEQKEEKGALFSYICRGVSKLAGKILTFLKLKPPEERNTAGTAGANRANSGPENAVAVCLFYLLLTAVILVLTI